MNYSEKLLFAFSILLYATPALTKDVSTENLFSYVTDTFPKLFCQPNTYFRDCFDISESVCKEAVTGGVEGCISGLKKKEQLPNFVDVIKGTNISSWIGACVGQAFENVLINHQVHSEQ